jgi:hypothetical protein
MENNKCQASEGKLLQHLGNLRKMIVHNHELENLSEFVLYDLCNGPCCNVTKAAYFINNPDFNILKGVAGYHKKELHVSNSWNEQKQFIGSMRNSLFNQKVRNRLQESFAKGEISEQYLVRKLADFLEIENPGYHVWDLKHANHGLLIYESLQNQQAHVQEHLHDSLYYLSFCPVF